jgi:methylenetetrahydrofolate--tRNA-(uracil-5-)-methyltransferase
MVGFQTRMKHGEQTRIFRSLPGLQDAEFVRLGSVHRNTFLNSPRCLSGTGQFRDRPGLFFAGQITGVEGYVESTASGYVSGLNVLRSLKGETPIVFPAWTAIGALMSYISDPERKDFQPMNVSFGLFPEYEGSSKNKNDRRIEISERSLARIQKLAAGDSSEESSRTSNVTAAENI